MPKHKLHIKPGNAKFSAMHRTFQRDLFRLRLMAAREFVKTIEGGASPVSTDVSLPLKVGAQVSDFQEITKQTP